MRSSSLKMIKDNNIPSPRDYRDQLIHEWFLPQKYIDKFEVYQIRTVKGYCLDTTNGLIHWKDREYNVVWLSGPKSVKVNSMAIISFRYCSLLEIGYALIKVFREDDNPVNIPMLEYEDLQ